VIDRLLDWALARLDRFLNEEPKPLITYSHAPGGWYAYYRGESAYGLTKRDAAKQAIRQYRERYDSTGR